MRRVLVLAALTALAVARPEMYKEKEDFQYSRSSSDDGTKSGYYGAQRGNMGGNYERAHNMDLLAQHQMGGLVRNVEGELGDGAKQKSGSVFSAASSRGVYGSGHYDLSNLEGRNFQEGTSVGDSQSHSSLSSSHSTGYRGEYSGLNSAYGSHSQNSRYSGYHAKGNSDQALYANNVQSADNLQSSSQYDATQLAHDTGYNSRSSVSGYRGQSDYDQAAAHSHISSAYGANNAYGTNVRLVSATPVKVYVRPGSSIAVPVAAQTFDTSHGSSSSFDHNAINSEAEVLGSNNQQTLYTPTNNAKHYESAYRYRKEWEKHDTIPATTVPLAVPTVNPFSSNSELYDDTQAHGSEHRHEASSLEAQNVHSSRHYSGYNVKSGASSQSRHQASAYNQHSAASDASSASDVSGSSGYTHGTYNRGASANLNAANLNNQVEEFSSKPKSYQSSYSYHKSWERQGDPYIIKPASNGLYTTADTQASQRLTASSNQGARTYRAHQHGTHYNQGQQGYLVNGADCDCDENGHIRVARSYNLGHDQVPYQQSQSTYEGQDLYQQSENIQQQSQNLEDFSEQSQNIENIGQESQKLEDLGQQLQDFGQQSQKLDDIGQQSQDLQDFGQVSQKLADFSQQSQNLEDFGQKSQNLEDFGQQSQKLEDFGQQSQKLEDLGQQSQKLEDFGQQTQDAGQQTLNTWDQQSQTDLGQQTQNTWSTLDTIQNEGHGSNTEQQLSDVYTQYNHHGINSFQSQETNFDKNTSNINTLKQPDARTPQSDNKDNPLAHVIFNQHREDEEKKDQGKEDIEKELNHLENMGQQTHTSWNHIQTNMNQNNPTVFVPILPLDSDRNHLKHQDWQQYLNQHNKHIDTGYGYNQHNHFYHNTEYSHPTNDYIYTHHEYIPVNNVYTNTFQHPGYGASVNSYTNTQTQYSYSDHSTHSTSNIHQNPHEPSSTSLTNLWNLLDNIEKETTSADGTGSLNSNNSHQDNKNFVQTNSNTDFTQNLNQHTFNTEVDTAYGNVHSLITTKSSKMETTTIKQYKEQQFEVERGDIGPEHKQQPREDIGRGDIGPDDSSSVNSNVQNKPLEIFESKPMDSKPYKTQEEIESLSLAKETNNTTRLVNAHSTDKGSQDNVQLGSKQDELLLSVLGLGNKKQSEHNEQDNWKLQSDIPKTTSTTPKSRHHVIHSNFNVGSESKKENTDQQIYNLNQEKYNQFEGFDQHEDQQNTNHHFDEQIEQFGKVHEENQFSSSDQLNINHHRSNVEFSPDQIQQPGTDQQIETLGQQSENLDQQSFNQFEDLDQQSENLGQELQLFDHFVQENEGFNQENMHEFGQHEFGQEPLSELDHHNENLNEPQKEQQLENWGQKNENLEQQSQIENLNQQLQSSWKPSEDVQQAEQVETFEPPLTDHKEGRQPHYNDPVVEPETVTKKTTNVDAPQEPVTEKVSFWNKVGSKFSSAKDKVSSWFSRS